jgi:hypothetical protein
MDREGRSQKARYAVLATPGPAKRGESLRWKDKRDRIARFAAACYQCEATEGMRANPHCGVRQREKFAAESASQNALGYLAQKMHHCPDRDRKMAETQHQVLESPLPNQVSAIPTPDGALAACPQSSLERTHS